MGWVDRQVVSIDWDVRTLRVVHFVMRSGGEVRIRKVLSVALPADLRGGDPTAVGHLIRQALDRERIAARRMVVDVPRDQAVLNTLRLPAVPDDDLPAMVEFQIGKELPFPMAAAAVDFAVADRGEDPNVREVLVAAVRQEVLEFYTQVAQAAGLKLDRVGLRPYANLEAVNELLGDTRRERVLFVDIGPALTEIDVLRDGKLSFSRAASVAVPVFRDVEAAPVVERRSLELDLGLRLTPAAPVAERSASERDRVVQSLLVEVTRTIEAYRAGDPGASMDHAVVGGDSGLEDELLEAIKRRFGITGERYNPGAGFGWDADSGLAAGGFAAALGLALGHAAEGRLDFDFAHPKKPVTRTQRRLSRAPLAAAVLLLFVGAAAVGYTKTIGPKKRQIAQLEQDVREREDRVKAHKKFEDMINKVEEFEGEQIVWIDELHDFLSVFPGNNEIVLNEIDMDQKGTSLRVKMDCRSRPIADEAVSRVEEFRLPDGDKPVFDATLEGTTDQAGEFTVRASMSITLVNRGKSASSRSGGTGGTP